MASNLEGKSILHGERKECPRTITLHQYFTNGFVTGRLRPENLALLDGTHHHTFQQLDDISTKIAGAILDIIGNSINKPLKNPDGDVVIGVCIQPSDRLVSILLGILKAGAAYVPFDITFPEERISKIVRDCRPLLVICDGRSNVLGKFDGVKQYAKVVSTDELYRKMMPGRGKILGRRKENGNPADETAIVLYTSGSSGEPKGVRLSHKAVMNRLCWQWNQFPYIPSEKCVLKTSLTFVDSVAEIFGPLLQGFQLVVFDKSITSQPPLFIEKLHAYEITRVVLVPSLLKAIFQTLSLIGVKQGQSLLKSVRLWVCSGEPMTYELLTEFFTIFPERFTLCNFYGSTEVMGDVTFVSYSNMQDVKMKTWGAKVPIGYPIFNTSIHVLTEKLEPVDTGSIGEIFASGNNLAKGYVGIPESDKFLNMKDTTSQFYRTGDFGRIVRLPNGTKTLMYEGRTDSQIKVRGHRVDLSEIEGVLSRLDSISKVKVLCYHGGQEDQAIVAYVVPKSQLHTQEQIKQRVEKCLRDYERPLIRLINEIPLLVNGKTDRQRLLRMFEAEIKNQEEFDRWDTLNLPQSKLNAAKNLFRVISDVTGASQELIAENFDDSFFNIGGTSLNAVVVIVRLREMNYYLSIPQFVAAKTIRDVLMSLEEIGDDGVLVGEGTRKKNDEYSISYLTNKDMDEAVDIISYSFSKKGDLEAYVNVTYNEYSALIESIWKAIVEKGFSFIVRRKSSGEAVAVSLSFDVYDEPENVDCSDGIKYVMEFLEHVESQQRTLLPKGKGKLLHSFMMGTPENIDDSERVSLIELMEEENMRMAKEKRFEGIFTTNTNPLTMQIGRDLHGYEILCEYQVNEYVAPNGKRPFALAPDSFRIICCWKKLN